MGSGFFTILQLLWPFIKEAIFGHGPFKTWLRRNYVTLVWFVLIVTMMVIVLGLSSVVRTLESDLRKSHDENDQFKKQQIEKDAKYKNDYATLQQKVNALQLELSKRECPVRKPPPQPKHPKKPPHLKDDSAENNSILHRLQKH